MLEWSIELLEPIYEEIVHAYYGTILVVDNDGKLIYGRRPLESKLDVDEETLVGRTIFDLEAEGIFSDTATSEALRSGQRAVRLVKGSAGPPLLAIATPIKDKMDNTSMVVTFSQDEELTLLTLQRFQEERDKSVQLASYLSQKPGRSTVISESPLTKAVLEALDKVAPTDATVLFIGETGTGKEVFSRYVHRKSSRRDEPFIPVNCSAIPADLIESELFGYAKGAFTGANKDGKSGLFELAERGTLFLDEIGELSLLAQSKVLRVLETGDIQKVGSEQTLHTNVRIIAATNRDLLQMVNEGKFRKDLYYRLSVFPVNIPPIRQRVEDIEPLASYFLSAYNQKYNFKKILPQSTLNLMKSYAWPGNVREIRNVIERMVIASSGDLLTPGDLALPASPSQGLPEGNTIQEGLNAGNFRPLKEAMKEFEKSYILQAIEVCDGNVTQAAEKLKAHKSGIYRKLDEYKNDFDNESKGVAH